MKRFKNRVVIITGASSGIGEALAYEFAKLGSKVVIAARNEEKLASVASKICGDVLPVVCDVSREEDCQKLINQSVAKFGGIDILICNAGISMRAVLDDVAPEVLRRLMDVNFWGTVYCTKYALPYLQSVHGSVVGVSSVAGLHGLPGRTGYSASKWAMTGFLETVRIENLHRGLHVMVACPGFTATNVRFSALTADGSPQGQTPREEGRMMTSAQVARIIIKGIRRRKRLLLMEWEGRATHFIKKFAPAFLDRMFYRVMAREPNSPLKA